MTTQCFSKALDGLPQGRPELNGFCDDSFSLLSSGAVLLAVVTSALIALGLFLTV
jgi:hypothetical protein